MTPRIIACYDGDRYRRFADVLKSTAERHCPDWDLLFSVVPMVDNEASKLRHWLQAVTEAPDGTPMLLMDADAMILHPLDEVWVQDFDLAYTARNPAWTHWPNNAGVIFCRASDGVRTFIREWLAKELPLLLTTGSVRKAWLAKFGAVEQAALDQQLKVTTLKVVPLPCLEWNCEDSAWAHFDPERTRIVHLKGALRKAILGHPVSWKRSPQVQPLARIWKDLARGAAAPEPARPPRSILYTAEWQEKRARYLEPARRCLEAAFKQIGVPRSLLDLGCGDGHLVTYAQARSIDAMGVDVSLPVSDGPTRYADLREPLDLGRMFDVVICWEVAEHLEASAADTLCDTIVKHLAPGGVLLFTAAAPGQTGKGHVNEQPAAYWRERFLARGLTAEGDTTNVLSKAWLKQAPGARWYGDNLQVFTSAGEGAVFQPLPEAALPSLVLTMRTADRAPKPNYLGATLRHLHAQGVDLTTLHLCVTDPKTEWLSAQLADGPTPILHIAAKAIRGNENGLAQVEAGLSAGADWIVLLEDDLVFCKDFIGSLRRWLRDADRPDRHLFRVFGFSRPPKGCRAASYDWPLEQLRGSQAMCIRTSEASDFLAWGRANLKTWCRDTPWRNTGADPLIAFDKFTAAWNTTRWPGVPGVVSHPYFVKHIGDKSSIHARGVRNDAPFAGEQWSYRAEAAV